MQGKQLRKLEAELWRAAYQLRANSKLTAMEYSMPVLGLMFLRHAYNSFQKVKMDVEKEFEKCSTVSMRKAGSTQNQKSLFFAHALEEFGLNRQLNLKVKV